ncbi:imidazolonepropionase [Oxobacter pfennigii]|uniref:Imidazolonepropionase n=1 Tax=Oxobacter pfennigii TaxID=36849 RepID=A0A0P9AD67_9CLOT|nr:amidohydrolase [Oxobacter pfennigii]KPU43050.1 imidazolonepropionase [Oxobacter pfennigii]
MESLLLKNCLLTDDNDDIFIKNIFIENGKIKEITDKELTEEKNTEVVDIKENHVLPGLIDCHTHLGIIEEGTGKIGIDNNETSEPVTPHLRGIDAINPLDMAFHDAVKAGITCVMSGPGSNNVVGGQNVAIKTSGSIIDEMIVKNPVGLKIAFGENPMNTYGADSKCPVTRMGTAALIRELFMRTQDYMELKERGKIKERNIRLEAVIPLLKNKISLRAHAHRADDIVTAVRIADEFNIKKLVIEHGTEAHLVKEYLRDRNIPVAFGPILTPRIKMELKRRKYNASLELLDCGVKVALITDHPYNSIEQLRMVAILAVSEGLSQRMAIRCITGHPAEILECQHKIGNIKKGYDADIAVFDGNPMDINSKVVMTIINGRIVYNKL